jgi:hypothetical protein
MKPVAPQWLRLREAALRLGVSTDTLRRRLKRGEMEGHLVPSRHGPAYEVLVAVPEALVVASQAGMSDLVARLHAELLALAERNGRLGAELDRAHARIRELESQLGLGGAPAILVYIVALLGLSLLLGDTLP